MNKFSNSNVIIVNPCTILVELGMHGMLTSLVICFYGQALYLEQILRETYAHPHIEGVVMCTGPRKTDVTECA